ncbi:MAG: hypothetical protein RSB09_01065 [Clostridia bacterium]
MDNLFASNLEDTEILFDKPLETEQIRDVAPHFGAVNQKTVAETAIDIASGK